MIVINGNSTGNSNSTELLSSHHTMTIHTLCVQGEQTLNWSLDKLPKNQIKQKQLEHIVTVICALKLQCFQVKNCKTCEKEDKSVSYTSLPRKISEQAKLLVLESS